MFYLVLISPLVGLGFLLGMQLFETWVLGDPDRPRKEAAGRYQAEAARYASDSSAVAASAAPP